jgi:hypothetical protein
MNIKNTKNASFFHYINPINLVKFILKAIAKILLTWPKEPKEWTDNPAICQLTHELAKSVARNLVSSLLCYVRHNDPAYLDRAAATMFASRSIGNTIGLVLGQQKQDEYTKQLAGWVKEWIKIGVDCYHLSTTQMEKLARMIMEK